MALMASDVKLLDPLKDPLAGISTKSRGRLDSALDRIKSRNAAGQVASGRPAGEYTGFELGRAGNMAGRGIDDSLYGVIGGSSYKDFINAQDHERNLALARRTGELNKPSLLEEVLGGLGSAGQLYTAGKSLAGRFPKRTPGMTSRPPAFDPYAAGMSDPDNPLMSVMWR